MDLFFLTTNTGKINEAKQFFDGSRFNILTLKDLSLDLGDIDENGTSLGENASIKARVAHEQRPDLWVFADDTGIFIDMLDGEPGIHAARWLRKGASLEETRDYCLERMKGKTDRRATFGAGIVLISPQGNEWKFEGLLRGTLREIPSERTRPNMPYSSLFMPLGLTQTLAELTIEYENQISHRGKALRQMKKFLEEIIEK